ncbi:conserved hypothetical protein, partial [Streptomyces albidoflavus]
SADSRYHRAEGYGGTVPDDHVVGRAVAIAWPAGHWRGLAARETYAAVPDAPGASTAADGASHKVASQDLNRTVPLPTPAELPLVMGVVEPAPDEARTAAHSEESMWGMWRWAHDPDASPRVVPDAPRTNRPSTPTGPAEPVRTTAPTTGGVRGRGASPSGWRSRS